MAAARDELAPRNLAAVEAATAKYQAELAVKIGRPSPGRLRTRRHGVREHFLDTGRLATERSGSSVGRTSPGGPYPGCSG